MPRTTPAQILAAARAIAAARHARGVSDIRLKQRLAAAERRHNRPVRRARTVEPPKRCARCGATLPIPSATGRPKLPRKHPEWEADMLRGASVGRPMLYLADSLSELWR